MRTTHLACLVAIGGLFATYACSTSEGQMAFGTGSTTSSTATGGTTSSVNISPNPTGSIDTSGEPATPGCGDGTLTPDETCDDGNKAAGDGCQANCRGVELGWSCPTAGQPCHQIARCGDSVMVFPELCDDGNKVAGDGCSPTCKFETGWKCEGQPSTCSHTTCGDGKVEGAESCEDGNVMPFDGCSADCQLEPNCGTGNCTSTCGDGLVINEECDDGNTIDGDGCSKDCKPEPGFTCVQPPLGDTMVVPMVVRDFNAGGDFEKGSSFATGLNYANQGLLKDALAGAKRKPALASSTGKYNGVAGKDSGIASAASFAMWYDETAAASGNTRNKSLATKLNLFLNADKTAYVNRYGDLGNGLTNKQYMQTTTEQCGNLTQSDKDADGNPIPCTVCYYDADPTTPQCDLAPGGDPNIIKTRCQKDTTFISCASSGTQWVGTFLTAAYDGNPTFFPADAITPANPSLAGQISGNYDKSWPKDPSGKMHNFSFTTEVRYWFKYDSAKNYKLSFVGDDDVWVFINNKLAVDLGGIHTAVLGMLTITGGVTAVSVSPTNETAAFTPITGQPSLGLTNGNIYEIVVLHAERQSTASSYQLTFSGFSAASSECSAFCGDGIVGIGEECDDGKNDGGYGECGPSCRLGEYCGDAIVQGTEECDDGVNVGSPCPSGCRHITLL